MMTGTTDHPQLPDHWPLANAPVSFGVWGPHNGPEATGPAEILQAIAAAGYSGSELGPTGFLGDEKQTAARFAEVGLQPAGVYVGLPLAGAVDGTWSSADLEAACRTLAATAEASTPERPAPIVLADDGAPALAHAPHDREIRLSNDHWRAACRMITEAQMIIDDHGLQASFHPHLATWVENADEVERLLADTDLGLTFDTGHLLLAGVDLLDALHRWGPRIDHVHLKDVSVEVMRHARRTGRRKIREWWGEACVPVGAGDIDFTAVIEALDAIHYDGWLVVEQDHQPMSGTGVADLRAEQHGNLTRVRRLVAEQLIRRHAARATTEHRHEVTS